MMTFINCHSQYLDQLEPAGLPVPTEPWTLQKSLSLRLSCYLWSRRLAVPSHIAPHHSCQAPRKYAYRLKDQFQYHSSPLPSPHSWCRQFWYRCQLSRSRQRRASPRLTIRIWLLLRRPLTQPWLGWKGRQPLKVWRQHSLQFSYLSPMQKARLVPRQNRMMWPALLKYCKL